MKKITLLLLVAAFAASPAAAATKKKAKKDVAAEQASNTMHIIRDGLPLVLPSWSLPLYFGMHMDTKKKM
jgi:hypothetical protein